MIKIQRIENKDFHSNLINNKTINSTSSILNNARPKKQRGKDKYPRNTSGYRQRRKY